ncbi:MAG: (Fe-S)-binding protein [Lysobacteraceae bacterium]
MNAPAPPAPSLAALADRCVQCGLCLPTCPTYRLAGLEAESPRGRIALIKALDTGTLAPAPVIDAHLDACLGCRRCEAVCPAGVDYGALLAGTRAAQRARRPTRVRQRAIEALAARPRTLARLLDAYRRIWPLLPRAARPLPRPPAPAEPGAPWPPPRSAPDAVAALFPGCVARGYDATLFAAVARLAAAAGIAIETPPAQTCCGSLHAHAGAADRAATLADTNRTAFAGHALVLGLSSGCHEALADALAGRAVVRDAIDVLAERADRLRFAPRTERIALHLPCTQRNVVRSDGALRALLAKVPGLEVVELDAGYGCCGAAGTAMLDDPPRAATFRQPLLDQLAGSDATVVLSANIGCRLHLANGTAVPVRHPLEFLAECLA